MEGELLGVFDTVGDDDGVFVSSIKNGDLEAEGATGYDEGDGLGVATGFR
jgi:hypothetical protein